MTQQKLKFITTDAILLLKNLSANDKGNWGKMNGQQMAEHVSAFFEISSNQIRFPLITPAEHLPKFREFLFSDKQFRENTKAPLEILGENPLPLKYKNMNAAVDELQKNIDEFIDYFKDDTTKTTLHPVFGELNFDEWILLHYKHVQHHFKQFSLI